MMIKFRPNGIIVGGICWNVLTEKRLNNELALDSYGYKVYSQNDEDGIIQEIFKRIGTTNKIFVEFGVEDGLESNCHYLLHKDWSGLWIDGNSDNVSKIKDTFHPVIQSGNLQVKCAFITKDNINSLIREAGIIGEIDLLSIDIDGNDYYVWESIDVIKPRVVVIEYNGKFPPDYAWKMEYNQNHVWNGSDLYGASLKAYERLGKKLGYKLVGTNVRGVNAFFVRSELTGDKFFEPSTSEALYNPLRLDLQWIASHPSVMCLKNR